ncbi:MAG: UvrB/UvrC motif-containing protein, partial [Proteobacteria bacterium]|nr:UvrB/UvrC motif-containing protein [Pseudomonadota bacterium]
EKSGAYLKFDFSDPVAAKKEIDKLETQMYEQARNLAFEEAAATRDQLADLRNRLLTQ